MEVWGLCSARNTLNSHLVLLKIPALHILGYKNANFTDFMRCWSISKRISYEIIVTFTYLTFQYMTLVN